MPIQSYLVVPEPGAGSRVSDRLDALPGCETTVSDDGKVLVLVVDTAGPEEEAEARARIEAVQEVQCLVLAFGEIDPETEVADPVAAFRESKKSRRGGLDDSPQPGLELPVLSHGGAA